VSDVIGQVKERHKVLWGLGNYPEVAKVLSPAAVHVVEECSVGKGTRLLDVGAGTGNVALEAARRGADVVATDLTPALLEVGKERTRSEGLTVKWQQADAEDLPFEDASFDVVTSTFGAMFAPRASVAAGEMLRVARPGGIVGFTCWESEGYSAYTLRLLKKYLPPPPEGVDGPDSWGEEAVARERFEMHGAQVQIRKGHVHWEFDSPESARRFAEENIPPMVAAKNMLPAERFEELMGEYREAQARFNQATDGRVVYDTPYLLVLARKKEG
jgi:SAM-dependent methyltransferase